jgi:hypothetical protein
MIPLECPILNRNDHYILCLPEQGKVYLEKHFLPPGVEAVAVERCEWLNAVVYGAGPAFVSIQSSRTDYLLLTKAGAAMLRSKGVSIDSVLEILPTVVGFYELKTPKAIKQKPMCRRQAILELVAGQQMCLVGGWFD